MLPTRESEKWILEAFGWLVGELGQTLRYPRPLILPSPQYFPVSSRLPPQETAMQLFHHLQRHVGLHGVSCEIVAQSSRELPPNDLPVPFIPVEPEAAAMFRRSVDSNSPHTITFHPELLQDHSRLIAIASHGLSHAALVGVQAEPPGGSDAWDYVTDVGAVLLGAGVFLANSADRIEREEGVHWQGLSVRCQGWLGQGDFAFSLAVFSELFGYQEQVVRSSLRLGPRLEFERAVRRLRRDSSHVDAIKSLRGKCCAAAQQAAAADAAQHR